jgi:2,3-dihydroxybenzoate---[aryl-carrier protein] ligase
MLDGCTPWPTEIAAQYRDSGYWRGEDLADFPWAWSRQFGRRTALVSGGRRVTYDELDRRVARMAAGFRKCGLRPGDRVVVQLPNVPEFVVVCFALFLIDAKPVFSLAAHRASEVRHLCTLTEAAGYVVPGSHRGFNHLALAAEIQAESPAMKRVFVADCGTPAVIPDDLISRGFVHLGDVDGVPGPAPAPCPSDVAFFLLSGGTTAMPKLIPRTHDDYAYQTRAAAELVGLDTTDVYLAALPAEFNFTWGCPGIIGTLRSGGTVVFVDDPGPAECFETIEREHVTVTSLVPALAQLWLDEFDSELHDLSSLRLIQIGGAPLHRETAEQITPTFGCTLQQVFGMAEGLLTFTRETDSPESIWATQGRPLSPGDEIRIVDEDGDILPAGRTGELLARGPYTLRGYYQAAEHNAVAFTEDGFYRTGDLARLTERGELVVEGRLKDVIIRGGSKVSAAEVEAHLLSHPQVARVAVVPIPDRHVGERVCAYVVPAGDPPTLFALRKALHERGVADYKLPDRVEVVDDLPLTGLGKVDKKILAKDAAEKATT